MRQRTRKGLYRERLLQRLGAIDGVAVIEASFGFGKSTLLQQFVACAPSALSIDREMAHRDAKAMLGEFEEGSVIAVVDDVGEAAELIEMLLNSPSLKALFVADRIVAAEIRQLVGEFDCVEFNDFDLRFTTAEVTTFAAELLGEAGSERIGHAVREETEGWPVAVDVAMAAIRLNNAQGAETAASMAVLANRGPHYDQLTETCLSGLNDSARDGFCQLAHLDAFTDASADALMGKGARAAAVCNGLPLVHRNEGLWSLPGPVANGIRRQSRILAKTADTVAPVLIADGHVIAAIRSLIAANQIKEAADAVCAIPASRIDELDQRSLLSVLGIVYSQAEVHPCLHIALARTYQFLGQVDDQIACLERGAASDDHEVSVEASVELLRIRAERQDPVVLEELVALEADISPATSGQVVRLREARGLILAQHIEPDRVSEAKSVLYDAATQWELLGEPGKASATLRKLAATALCHLGEYTEATSALSRAKQLSSRLNDRAQTLTLICRFQALAGNLSEFDGDLPAARSLIDATGLPWLRAYSFWDEMTARALAGCEDAAIAAAAVAERELGQLKNEGTGAVFYAEAARAMAQLQRPDRANRYLALAKERRRFNQLEVAIAEIVVSARQGEFDEAEERTRALEATGILPPSRVWRLRLELSLALDGHAEYSRSGPLLIDAAAEADAIGLGGLVALLTADQAAAPTKPPEHNRVRVRVLGNLECEVNDQPVLVPNGHAGSLLKLLAAGNGFAQVEVISEHLWPGQSAAVGRRRLKNVISRLRGLLGSDSIGRSGDTISLGDSVSVDLIAFVHSAHQALDVLCTDRSDRVDLIVNTLNSYTCDAFQDDLYVDWAHLPREHARTRALATLDACFALDSSLRPQAPWLLDVLLRISPLDDQRLLNIARQALGEQHISCARSAIRHAIHAADELGIDLVNELDDLKFLLHTPHTD